MTASATRPRYPFDWITRHTSGVVRQGLSFEKVMEASLIDLRHGDNRDLIRPAQFLLLCMNTALGVNSTPTLILGSGERVTGSLAKADLTDLLDAKP